MVNIDATTPQLKFVKEWIEAYTTIKADVAEPFLSRKFVHKRFPKTNPDRSKAEHLKTFGWMADSFSKMEVCI